MEARDYMETGYMINDEGWIITLHDYTNAEQYPVAIHRDTGEIYPLEYNQRWADDDDNPYDWDWSVDWQCTPLDDHWGDYQALINALNDLYIRGAIRAEGAIHGLPGSSSLGAILI